jgi:hypothetical protein
MKALRLIAPVVLMLSMLPAIAAAQTVPAAPILRLANLVVHVANTGDASVLNGAFTSDATVVDENAPFVWRGASAGRAWWTQVIVAIKHDHLTHFRATNVRLAEYKHTSTDAYLVQPMTIVGVSAGKPFAESGTMTYTFHNSGGNWLISTMVWSTKP